MTPRLNLLGLVLSLGGAVGLLNAQDQGALDADFQDGGTLLLAPFESTSFENAQDVLVLDDGSIIYCGVAGSVGNFEATVMKLDIDGNVDASFGTDGVFMEDNDLASDQAYDIEQLPDGRIVVGGAMGYGGSDYVATLWCLLPDGTLDPDFGVDGRFQYEFDAGEEYIREVLVTDTHITMVATVAVPGFSYDRIGLVQCTHDGTLDADFGVDGAIIHTVDATTDVTVRAGARLEDGGIGVAGYTYSTADNNEYPMIAMFDALGNPVEGFGTGGISFGTEPGIYFAMATGAGRIYAGGRANMADDDFLLSAFTPDGAPDATFADAGHLVWNQNLTDVIFDMELDFGGRIVASGTSGQPGFFGDRDFAVMRILPDGTPDPIFGTGGITTTSFGPAFEDANGMAITPDNKVVCVGMSAQTNNDFAIARYFLGPVIDHVDEWDMGGVAYPNPTTGRLDLPTGMLDEEWSLLDALGRPVDCAIQRFGARTELDLSGLTEGVYLLTGTKANGRFSERILLQR